jgi:hypothetical protein
MAQAGFTPIVTYHSTTASAVPTAGNLSPGELALNINDMKLYCENSSGVVTLLASAAGASGDVTLAGNNAFTGANTFYNGTGQTFGTATSSQDGLILAGRAGGSSSYRITLQPTTLASSTTLSLPNVTDTVATIGTAQTFTAAQTFRAASAIRSEAASTQDAVVVAGRAGGTNSFASTITPTTLSASRTVTLPDETFTVGFRNIPAGADKTSSYALTTADVGKVIGVGTGGSITIPDATFAAGDAVIIFNNTTGSITITCTITTAYIAGADTDKATLTLATRGIASILFVSGTVCVVSGNVT